MTDDHFRAAYFLPDIAYPVATFQGGHYHDVAAMQRLVIPPPLTRDSFPHGEYAALAATLDPWLSEHGLARLSRLFDGLDDMHIIMLLHAAYSGRVDVVRRALAIRTTTPALLLLMVDVAAWKNQRPVLDYLVHLPHDDGWACSAFALIAASREGHLDMVRFLHERFPLVPTTEDAMDMAATEGHLDVVEFLHAHRPEGCTTRAMDGAAKNGHVDVLRFLHVHRREGCTEQAMDGACEHGHLEMAQWLYEHRRWEGWTENAFDGAAANNHFPIVEFLHHVVHALNTYEATKKAAAAGHWAMVMWIHDHRPIKGWTAEAAKIAARLQGVNSKRSVAPDRRGFADAIESGDEEAMQWLHRHRRDEDPIHEAMILAASFGEVEVVPWLKNRATVLYMLPRTAYNACEAGRLDLVKMLYAHDADSFSSASVSSAASGGRLDVIEWLFDQGVVPDPSECNALDRAACSGHLHVVQWLHARSFPATVAAMDGAAACGHLHVIRWLHKHRQEGCSQAAVGLAAGNGYFSVVRWLIRRRRLRSCGMGDAVGNGDLLMLEFLWDTRSKRTRGKITMNPAASSGHLNILLFLHSRQMGRCTADAFCYAVEHGHFQVAKWLRAVYGFQVTRDVVVGAIKNDDLVCLRWLLEHWQGGVLDVDYRKMQPRLAMLQFLLEMGGACSADSMDYVAAGNGFVAELIKMHEFGATCSSDAMRKAANEGLIDVVLWLNANRTEGCAEGSIEGHSVIWSSMVNFMVNAVVPVTACAMIQAAERGDLDVVRWLYGCGSWATRDRFVRQVDMTSVVAWANRHAELETAQWILKMERLSRV